MKHENAQERTLSASTGKHHTYGALYRNVLHDIPMEVQVIMQMINRLHTAVWTPRSIDNPAAALSVCQRLNISSCSL
jgi:hypothetical protein